MCVCVCVTCCVCACVCVSGPRLASRLRMFLSDIWSRTATGGIRAMVAGRRVTSAFMSLSSSSSCFSTKREREGGRASDEDRSQQIKQSCDPVGSDAVFTFVQDGVGRLVPGHGLFAEVLVRLGQTLHLAEARVEGHGGVGGVLRHVEVGGAAQLLLDHQRLLQQLEGRRRSQRGVSTIRTGATPTSSTGFRRCLLNPRTEATSRPLQITVAMVTCYINTTLTLPVGNSSTS